MLFLMGCCYRWIVEQELPYMTLLMDERAIDVNRGEEEDLWVYREFVHWFLGASFAQGTNINRLLDVARSDSWCFDPSVGCYESHGF